jgi:hypothetical protein
MKITARKTHYFTEIKVDEIETTIFKTSKKGAEDMIRNLLSVIDILMNYTDKSIEELND